MVIDGPVELHRFIKETVKASEWTQSAIAKKLGVDRVYVNKILNKPHYGSHNIRIKILNLLGYSVDENREYIVLKEGAYD